MSFFNELLSAVFVNPKKKYSNIQQSFSTEEFRRLFRSIHMANLTMNEKETVEDAIIARKGNDGKISLRQIYETLHHLRNEGKISKIDEQKLLEVFKNSFNN